MSRMELPKAFLERMKREPDFDYEAFISQYALPPVRGLRVNTLKLSMEEFRLLCPWKTKQADTMAEGLILDEPIEHIGSDPYHAAGLFYMQEPSAMSVVANSDIAPGMKVLDLCAAPGGKSGGIAARLSGKGLLISNEPILSRAKLLVQNLERLGVMNAAVTNVYPNSISKLLPRFFDRVLVDAPCSGEGMFRKDARAIAEWSPEHVLSCAVRQKAILNSAAECVAPCGKLIYSTCTFSHEENEGVIDDFLAAHPEFELEFIQRLYPHTCCGEGHFIARLAFSGGTASNAVKLFVPEIDKKSFSITSAFLDETFNFAHCSNALSQSNAEPNNDSIPCSDSVPGIDFIHPDKYFAPDIDSIHPDKHFVPGIDSIHLDTHSGRVFYLSMELPEAITDLNYLSMGVEIGTMMKGRLKPSHGLFMAEGARNELRFSAKKRIEFEYDSAEIRRFLSGNTIPIGDTLCGYMPVTVNGFPIGFGKAVDGTLKNHLPKGLHIPFYR